MAYIGFYLLVITSNYIINLFFSDHFRIYHTGKQSYSDVEYSGVLHVNDDKGIDYLGVVFGYQSNKRFYVVMWRHQNMNYKNDSYKAGTRGIQLKVMYILIKFLVAKEFRGKKF